MCITSSELKMLSKTKPCRKAKMRHRMKIHSEIYWRKSFLPLLVFLCIRLVPASQMANIGVRNFLGKVSEIKRKYLEWNSSEMHLLDLLLLSQSYPSRKSFWGKFSSGLVPGGDSSTRAHKKKQQKYLRPKSTDFGSKLADSRSRHQIRLHYNWWLTTDLRKQH